MQYWNDRHGQTAPGHIDPIWLTDGANKCNMSILLFSAERYRIRRGNCFNESNVWHSWPVLRVNCDVLK